MAIITTINRIASITTINRVASITTINRIASITTINRVASITTINRVASITTNRIATTTIHRNYIFSAPPSAPAARGHLPRYRVQYILLYSIVRPVLHYIVYRVYSILY